MVLFRRLLGDVLRDVADAVSIEEAAALGVVVSTPIGATRPTGDVVASAA